MRSIRLNSASGVYAKTACVVNMTHTQSQAVSYCESNSMKLFQITDATTQNQIVTSMQTIYGASITFRMDGLRDTSDGNWYYNSYGKTPVFSGLWWLTNSNTFAGSDSLTIGNMAYPNIKFRLTFRMDGVRPNIPLPIVCEYV